MIMSSSHRDDEKTYHSEEETAEVKLGGSTPVPTTQRSADKLAKGAAGRFRTWLPGSFQPTENDVICGRGRTVFTHNAHFRRLVSERLQEYRECVHSKNQKSQLIARVVHQVRSNCKNGIHGAGGFVKLCGTEGRWYEVGDFWAREKTSQAFRDVLDLYKSSIQAKKIKRRHASSLTQEGKQSGDCTNLPALLRRRSSCSTLSMEAAAVPAEKMLAMGTDRDGKTLARGSSMVCDLAEAPTSCSAPWNTLPQASRAPASGSPSAAISIGDHQSYTSSSPQIGALTNTALSSVTLQKVDHQLGSVRGQAGIGLRARPRQLQDEKYMDIGDEPIDWSSIDQHLLGSYEVDLGLSHPHSSGGAARSTIFRDDNSESPVRARSTISSIQGILKEMSSARRRLESEQRTSLRQVQPDAMLREQQQQDRETFLDLPPLQLPPSPVQSIANSHAPPSHTTARTQSHVFLSSYATVEDSLIFTKLYNRFGDNNANPDTVSSCDFALDPKELEPNPL